MKYLLVPENNSLSHVAKALAIREALMARGHEALVAISAKRAWFLQQMGIPHAVLPDLQETDGSGFPSVEWFRKPQTITESVEAELRLLRQYRPDRVLGVFRFTLKAAARLAGIPYDSLVCGCMLPGASEALGFAPGEAGSERQREFMAGFFRYAGLRLSQGLAPFGLPAIEDCRQMLVGERTFLWDFPGFMPLAQDPSQGVFHIGPIPWNRWPYDGREWERLETGGRPLAVVSFGTCVGDAEGAIRLVRILGRLGYHVLLTAGNRLELVERLGAKPWLTVCEFAPLHRLLPQVKLLISHGGQMSIFEAMAHKIPVAVMPFQPEQAHNGVCLEHLGCGRRLVPGRPFLGDPTIYLEALAQRGDGELEETITALTEAEREGDLAAAAKNLERYRGVDDLIPMLEVA